MKRCNIGCGHRDFGKDWIHIDGGDYSHLDYRDITRLEFKDESIDLIYASHVIEYFDREEIVPVLKEWRRVLLYGRMEMNGEWIYHKTVYDSNCLYHLLLQNGFHSVHRWDWRKTEHSQFDDFSQAHIPHMDKKNGTLISLNMEATK